jgi:hypothetical protein
MKPLFRDWLTWVVVGSAVATALVHYVTLRHVFSVVQLLVMLVFAVCAAIGLFLLIRYLVRTRL